jgi:queuine tRNA-ribosyltransferase
MGMGTPVDLVEGIARGVDMYDCVLPTRNGRTGNRVHARRPRGIEERRPHRGISHRSMPECHCSTCRRHTRAYLRHLFMAGEMLGPMLATQHNLYFFADVMREARQSILDGTFASWRTAFVERYSRGEAARARDHVETKGESLEFIQPLFAMMPSSPTGAGPEPVSRCSCRSSACCSSFTS